MAVPQKQFASSCWRKLNGLLCVYKPANVSLGRLVANLRLIIPSGLNRMVIREPRKIERLDLSLGIPAETIETDYSDHPLVIGPRYETSDIRYYCASALTYHSSGVCMIGLNQGRYLAQDLEDSKPLRVYHILAQLGLSTDTLFKGGKIVEKASYSGVYRPVIDKIVAAMQASHQRFMYMNAGVPLDSQEAYNLAVKGLLRPANDGVPIIYGLKCISFEKPFFTLEVTCANEREDYLLNLVHTIGLKARSVARCNSIKCIRYGPFNLQHALLRHSWKVEQFVSNIEMCNAINEEDIKSGRRLTVAATPLSVAPSDEGSRNSETSTVLVNHKERRKLQRLQSKEINKEEV